MKKWLQYFFLGYFSNKITKQSPKRGLGNMFLAIALSLLVLLIGLLLSATLPTKFLYNNADNLRQTVEKTFSDVKIAVLDGKVVAGKTTLDNQVVVNTVVNSQDKAAYSTNGYEIIVDTRPVDLYDDFVAVCVTESGKEISYEDYLALDAEVKSLYSFQIKYSGNVRVIDEQWVARCTTYLDGVSDEQVATQYAEVKKLVGEEYNNALYELYVKAYYPDLSKYETGGVAPKVRSYYTHNYNNQANVLFVFDDSLIARFTTNTGAQQVFYGFYLDMPNGEVDTSPANVHNFLLQCFRQANAIVVYNCIVNFMFILPYLVFVSFIVVILTYCLYKIVNKQSMPFAAVGKTVCNFLLWTTIFTSLVLMATSLLVSQSSLYGMACIIFFAILLLRAVIYVIVEWHTAKGNGQKASSSKNQTLPTNQMEENI